MRIIVMKISAKKIEQEVLLLTLAFVMSGGIGCAKSNLKSSCMQGEWQECSCDGKGVQNGLRVCVDGRDFSECACGPLGENISSAGRSSSDAGRAGTGGIGMGKGGAGGSGASMTASGAAGKTADPKGTGATTATGYGGTAFAAVGVGGNVGSGGVADVTQANGGSAVIGSGGTGNGVTGAGGSQPAANGGTSAIGENGASIAAAGGVGSTVEPYKYFCTAAPTALPTPSEPCPTMATTYSSDGTTSTPLTFKGKRVELIVGTKPTPESKGPLVFYWHPLGDSAFNMLYGMAPQYNPGILERGGVMAAIYSDLPTDGGTIAPQWDEAHLVAADEVVACAIQQIGIDTCRIHAGGFSAGGLMATQMSYRRSNYLASVVIYSGGINAIYPAPTPQDPANKFAAMIAHGGDSDVVSGLDFQAASINYRDDLRNQGHFAFICNHGGGHDVPESIAASAWQFYRDHPYGVTPEPYQGGLPASFPSYCSL
jgi:predicted esterase